jgi:F-type H+-transporting ATPase subunit delta
MAEAKVAGYARALFAVAEAEGALERVAGEVYGFAKTMEQTPELRDALTDAALPVQNRIAVIDDVLTAKAHPATATLIGMVVEAGHARDLGKIAEELASITAAEREHVLAEVRSAVALDDAQQLRLAEVLSRATGHTVDIKVVVDPSIVGGVVARVGDLVFDGSVATRLDEARQHLGAER